MLSLTARGEWGELPELFVLALDGGTLLPWQCAAFAETGSIALEAPPSLDAEEEIVCACLSVRREVRRAILVGAGTVEAIRERCRAGGACGACKPRLREMLGKTAWTPARVVEVTDVAADIRAFRIVPSQGEVRPALPGQHVVLQAQIDGRWIERPYTLSAPTSKGYYEVTIKREPRGLFSSWFFHRRLREALIRVSEPQGAFTAPAGDGPVVYLVAGIGVTPAIAVCRAIEAEGARRRVHIEYSARRPEVCAYAAEIERAAAAGRITAKVRFTDAAGRLGAEGVARIVAACPGGHYLLCGPAGYIASMRALLVAGGVAPGVIHAEEFVSAGEGVPPPSVPLSLRVLSEGPASLRRVGPPSSHTFALPPSVRKPMAPGEITAGAVCPFAHGTHREDGIRRGAARRLRAEDERRGIGARLPRAVLPREGAPRAFAPRWAQVSADIERTGTYTHTFDELSFGAKLAWRNSTRCIGRLFWNGLQVRDLRHLTTAEEMWAGWSSTSISRPTAATCARS